MFPDSMLGRQLGPYRLLEQLGAGGRACMFSAQKLPEREKAAIKVLDLRTDPGAAAVEDFKREAERLKKLRHPGLAPVIDYGNQDGLFYLVMPWIEGVSLARLLESYRNEGAGIYPTATEILTLMHPICQALDWAHQNDIIHRNLSPANILVDGDGQPHIGDFALDWLLQRVQIDQAVDQQMYVAPEVLVNSKNASPQSDLFSAGVLLYTMVVGKPPFDQPTINELGEIYSAKKSLPDDRLPAKVRRGVSEPVEKVILQAMAWKPADRFPSGRLLINALASAFTRNPLTESAPASDLSLQERVKLLLAGEPLPPRSVPQKAFENPGNW
ncbi:MAG TPA: serine/threonine-protein kinase, partial [Anaerolineales bacterium]|nr:serine/threonine-protein kinase [Anaerolineales bacterium]